jgi:hypothetical protein
MAEPIPSSAADTKQQLDFVVFCSSGYTGASLHSALTRLRDTLFAEFTIDKERQIFFKDGYKFDKTKNQFCLRGWVIKESIELFRHYAADLTVLQLALMPDDDTKETVLHDFEVLILSAQDETAIRVYQLEKELTNYKQSTNHDIADLKATVADQKLVIAELRATVTEQKLVIGELLSKLSKPG